MKRFAPIVLVLIVGVFFWRYIFQGLMPIPADTLVGLYHPFRDTVADQYPNGIPYKNFLITDPIRQQYPWRHIAIESMRNGELPLWNPYSFSGTPLLANIQSAPLYPLNFILFLVPFSHGWSILVLMQPVLSAICMYLLLRRYKLHYTSCMLGALTYAFSGVSVAWLTWNTIGHVLLWLPLILYLIEILVDELKKKRIRRSKIFWLTALLSFAEISYWLAGHLQIAFYVWMMTNIYLGWLIYRVFQKNRHLLKRMKRRLFYTFGCVAVMWTIATFPLWVSAAQFIVESGRTTDLGMEHYEGWFIPWQHLIQFIAPDYFGNPATLNYWGVWNYGELVGYIGLLPFIFVLITVFAQKNARTRFWLWATGIVLVCAIDNPISRIPYILDVPFLSTAQPTRLLSIIVFGGSILAAQGMDMVIHHVVTLRRIMFALGVPVLGLLIAVYASYSIHDVDALVARRNLILPMLLVVSFLVLIFIQKIAIRTKRPSFRLMIVPTVILVITIFDLFRFGWKFTPFVRAEYVYPESTVTTYLQDQDDIFRFMTTDDRILPPNISSQYRLESVEGYDPLYSGTYGELVSTWVRNEPDISPFSFNRILTPHDHTHSFVDLLNVEYILTFDTLDENEYELVHVEGMTKIYRNRDVLPRYYYAQSIIYASSKQEAIERLYELDPLDRIAVIESSINVGKAPITEHDTIDVVQYSSNSIMLHTNTVADRFIVTSDILYPAWSVYIDGAEQEIVRTNFAFRGVVVPRGAHTVEFRATLW